MQRAFCGGHGFVNRLATASRHRAQQQTAGGIPGFDRIERRVAHALPVDIKKIRQFSGLLHCVIPACHVFYPSDFKPLAPKLTRSNPASTDPV